MTDVLSSEVLDAMLEDIGSFSVELAEDPTLPQFGHKYLQQIVSKCRHFTNRTMDYMQTCKRHEKVVRRELKTLELDLEFKMKEKLADDALVRTQPSIEDRKALASSMLREEHESIAHLQVKLMDLEETSKVLRMRYQDLQRTSSEIKMQWGLVKDDRDDQRGGGEGRTRETIGRDRSIPNGMTPAIRSEPISPSDILDPSKRPDDLPDPVDSVHAEMISHFLDRNSPKPEHRMESNHSTLKHRNNGLQCPECKKPQFDTPSGASCVNGHGGLNGAPFEMESEIRTMNYDDLLG